MADELILIIEDNEKNRKLCRDVLQVKGYRTIESETAEQGLDLARGETPALILMDIQLPGMDGITAMRQLKADAQTQNIPIIAITASAMTNNRTSDVGRRIRRLSDQADRVERFFRRSGTALALRG